MQLHAGEFVDEAREAAVETCHRKILKQAQDPQRRPARFSGSGLAGEDEVFAVFQPGAFQLQALRRSRPRREAKSISCGKPIGKLSVGAYGGFAIEHQAEPFIDSLRSRSPALSCSANCR